jgi:hypothetical protein
MVKTTFIRINARMDKSDRGMSNLLQGLCEVVHGLTSIRTLFAEMALHFQLDLNKTEFLSFPAHEILKDSGHPKVVAVSLTLLAALH